MRDEQWTWSWIGLAGANDAAIAVEQEERVQVEFRGAQVSPRGSLARRWTHGSGSVT